jgi:hypothetical protein
VDWGVSLVLGVAVSASARRAVSARDLFRYSASAMSYGMDLAKAARRHFEAAALLDEDPPKGRRDVAGYLYGIAAECALKEIMWRSGMRKREDDRRNDPFYMHFPDLKRTLRDSAKGRFQSQLLQYAHDSRLMNEWEVEMRYAPSSDVLGKPIEKWAEQAKKLLTHMEEAL